MKRKKPLKLSPNTNTEPKYAIVDEEGKILEKFRLIQTAHQMLGYYKHRYSYRKIKIIRI